MTLSLTAPAEGRRPPLLLRPWRAADLPGLLAAPDPIRADAGVTTGPGRWTVPGDDDEAAAWLADRDRGWHGGDWLTLAVLDQHARVVGQVGLKDRAGGRVGDGGFGEIGYWTAADARGLGIAPAAVRAMTRWAFGSFGPAGLPLIMLVHDVRNAASCRVAEKSGYRFRELSPANPPLWHTAGHVHVTVSRPGMPLPASLVHRAD